MDSEIRCIAVESVHDDDSRNSPTCASSSKVAKADESSEIKTASDDHVIKESNSVCHSPSTDGSSQHPSSKGYGLRKWRRIRREIGKDAFNNSDNSKALKRGLHVSVNKAAISVLADAMPNSEDSTGSVNMPYPVPSVVAAPRSSVSEPLFVANGVDSENSDDRSSRSSTAASAPRMRHILPSSGHGKEKHKGKSVTVKSFNASNNVEPKSKVEGSKKARGEAVKAESEQSLSSVESDSRSSNSAFVQEALSGGIPIKVAMSFDGENGDDAHAGGLHFNDEPNENCVQETAEDSEENEDNLHYSTTNGARDKIEENGFCDEQSANFEPDDTVNSSEDTAADIRSTSKEENDMSGKMTDPLAETLNGLESLRAALQMELNKFGEIRTQNLESLKLDEDGDEPSICDELQVMELTEKVKDLELRLAEALHAQSTVSRTVYSESISESEVEDLYKQKIESDVTKLALAMSLSRLSSPEIRHTFAPMDEVAKAKSFPEAGNSKCGDDAEDARMKMEGRMRRVTACFLVQFVLLLCVAAVFLLRQLFVVPVAVVPT